MRCYRFLFLVAVSGAASALDCNPGKLKTELLQRKEADQNARHALLSATSQTRDLIDKALQIDADNTKFMRSVVETCGWPTVSTVGEDGAQAAWLITQHADMDPEYQVLASRKMLDAVRRKEASPFRLLREQQLTLCQNKSVGSASQT